MTMAADDAALPALTSESLSAVSSPLGTPGLDGDDREPTFEEADGDDSESGEDLLADYPDETEELELTHCRLRSLSRLRLQRFNKSLKRLCLRQNLLSSLKVAPEDEPTEQNGDFAVLETLKALEDLDLYDNRLPSVDGLAGLTALKTLDLSFNLLRRIPSDVLATMSSLKTLYLIQNKISHIEGLAPLAPTLTSIELGGNKLRRIEGLESLVNLTELWLGKNKISKLEGLSSLVHLRILSMQSNRVTVFEGLDTLVALEELYLSHNGVTRIGGLEHNTKLRVLDVSNNRLEAITDIAHLANLEEFWANGNKLASFAEVESQLVPLKKLETVYLEANPLQTDLGTAYRRRLMLALPQLKQIDATYVKQS